MKHIGLFEGIGGFSLAARWMGWETIAWCEWNEFGQRVLRHHFPEAEGFGDITKTNFTKYANRIDILTGGFPCQPYSTAGKRLGKEDSRHLWPEMCRAIREIQPTWVVGENVLGLVSWSGGLVFHEVQADLEAQGYEVQPYVLPACAVNAPHRRDRVWFVAYAIGSSKESPRKSSGIESNWSDFNSQSEQRRGEAKQYNGCANVSRNATHSDCDGQYRSNGQHEVNASQGGKYAQHDTQPPITNTERIGRFKEWDDNGFIKKAQQTKCGEQQFSRTDSTQSGWRDFPTQSPIRFGDDGLSTRLDSITFPKWRAESIKAAGNAIVPQVALQIFKAIQLYHS